MKKVKVDPNKVIRVEPRMVKESSGMSPMSLITIVITLMLLGSLLVSCKEQESETVAEPPKELSKTTDNYYQRVAEFTYEGCEYIRVGFGKSIWGAHKGNCKNPIHKTNE
jgi:hypothetical protein